jgi:hypothetical protein
MTNEPRYITFWEFFEPPLESGDYIASVNQVVSSAGKFSDSFKNSVTFAVQGIRFSLPPSYLQTQFPPPGGQGAYGQVLPHVVITMKTLPWQRNIGLHGLTKPASWLALLVFDETDPAPVMKAGTLTNFEHPPAGTVSYPSFTYEYGQKPDEPCNYIDVPAQLFTAVAPLSSELYWLAHARTVSDSAVALRALAAGVDTPLGECSVVVGNRLAIAGHKTCCFLVSLEGMGPYLPDQEGLGTAQFIRLAVLAGWAFSSVEVPVSFREYLLQLNREPATLQVPYSDATGTRNAAVEQALLMGYTAFAYHSRQSADLVSWYRGPLLPFDPGSVVEVPAPSADGLTCYDPETGLLDVSYAAAWQLGRLLALNDLGFATTLYNWKRGEDQKIVNEFENEFLAGELLTGSKGTGEKSLYKRLMNEHVKQALSKLVAGRTQ